MQPPRRFAGMKRLPARSFRVLGKAHCGIYLNTLFLQSDTVIHGDGNFLLGTQRALRGLDRQVSQQKLDLLLIASRLPAQLRARAVKVLGNEVLNSDLFRGFGDHSPDGPVAQAIPTLPPFGIARSNGPSSSVPAACQTLTACLTHTPSAAVGVGRASAPAFPARPGPLGAAEHDLCRFAHSRSLTLTICIVAGNCP